MRASSMTSLAKRIVVGAFIAACGAFVWALVVFEASGRSPIEWWFGGIPFWGIPLAAGYAVLIASWFVLPIGGVLGALMPAVVRGCSRRRAFIRGFFLGICAALVAAIFTMILTEWPDISRHATIVDRAVWWQSVRDAFLCCLVTMTPICAVWVGVWALLWSRKVWYNTALEPTATAP